MTGGTTWGTHEARGSRQVRVMTYNVRHLSVDPAAAAAVVRAAAPDVLGLQEPPRTAWGRVRLRRWARLAGMRVVVAGGAARTTALLVAPRLVPATQATGLRLPWWDLRPARRSWTRRGAVVARAAGVRVVVVHLGLDAQERVRHVEALLDRFAADGSRPVPTVALGDLNEPPTGPAWSRLAVLVRDPDPGGPPTFPAVRPRHRIDAVLVGGGLTASSVTVPADATARRASDHLPVVADIELGGVAPVRVV